MLGVGDALVSVASHLRAETAWRSWVIPLSHPANGFFPVGIHGWEATGSTPVVSIESKDGRGKHSVRPLGDIICPFLKVTGPDGRVFGECLSRLVFPACSFKLHSSDGGNLRLSSTLVLSHFPHY